MVLHKIQGTGLCSCGLVILFNSAASFTKQDFESMDSTLFFLFSYRNYRYTDPKYTATQLLFFFEKFLLKLWQLWFLFCLSFQTFQTSWDFKARCHFGRILAPNCGPSPRFTNRVQSAFH